MQNETGYGISKLDIKSQNWLKRFWSSFEQKTGCSCFELQVLRNWLQRYAISGGGRRWFFTREDTSTQVIVSRTPYMMVSPYAKFAVLHFATPFLIYPQGEGRKVLPPQDRGCTSGGNHQEGGCGGRRFVYGSPARCIPHHRVTSHPCSYGRHPG